MLASEPAGAYQVVGKRGGRVFVYTTQGAPRGRVIARELGSSAARPWVEVVPEEAEAVYDDNHPVRPTVGLFGDRLAVLYGRGGRLLLRVYDLEGGLRHELEHPELGGNESALLGHPAEAVVRFDVQSTFDPGTAYEVDLHTGERRVIGRPRVPFDPGAFVQERRSYRSHDGTEIPILLAHRRDLVRDGSNPVLLTNWAVLGMVARPAYLFWLHAWIELGGVVAAPAARGSGEYGEEWHRAGAGRHKLTSLDDLAAAADWLARSGYSRADRVVMEGSSMTGAPSAGVFVRHPDSFGAGLFLIPRVDLLAERTWLEEYGDYEDPDDFAAMLEWLPLQNADRGYYPAALVQVGSDDTVARPFHGYKLAAALQAAQRGNAPIRLQVVWGAGHSQGIGVPNACRTRALQYAFLFRELGVEPR